MAVKVKLLSAFSGALGSFAAGERIDVDAKTATRMVYSGIAEPADAAAKRAIAKAKKEIEDEAKAKELELAQAERAKLEAELDELYGKVVDLEAKIEGVAIDDETKAKLVDELKNRETKVKKESE